MIGVEEISEGAKAFRDPKRYWGGQCEAAMNNLCKVFGDSPPRSFDDATLARRASKIEGSGIGPGQNFVWMSNVWGPHPVTGKNTDFGHTAYHIAGGLGFMASAAVDPITGFRALGFIDLYAYLRRFPNQKLEGWSWDHGGTKIIDPEEFDMLSPEDRKLLTEARDEARGLSQRLDRIDFGDLNRDHDNIGAHITSEANRIRDDLATIAQREGAGSRAIYCDPEKGGDGRLVVISEEGPWWRDFTHANDPWAEVEQLASRGWCQPVKNAHRLNTQEFEYHMRNANTTFLKDTEFPAYLMGQTEKETP